MGTVEWINLIWVFFMSGENPGYLISTAGFHETRSYIAISLAYYGLNPLLQSTKVWGTIKLWAEWRISHLCPKVFFPRGHDVEVQCFNDFNVHIVCVCVWKQLVSEDSRIQVNESRRWFQISFVLSLLRGPWSNLTIFLQMGWNLQPPSLSEVSFMTNDHQIFWGTTVLAERSRGCWTGIDVAFDHHVHSGPTILQVIKLMTLLMTCLKFVGCNYHSTSRSMN